MIRRLLALLLAAALPAAADVPAPANWRSQKFDFPLAFAPSLPYEGTEHERFTPTFTDFDAPDGFSYVVMWDLKPAPLEPEALERALAVYFDGLMHNAAGLRKVEAMVPLSAVVLHPLAAPKDWADAYAGRVHTWNGFAKAETLVLNVEVAVRTCDTGRMQVFYAFSKAPRTAPVWQSLREVRGATTCRS